MADVKYEEIILHIDPETLKYETQLTYCDVEDLYIVLRDLIFRMESGEIYGLIPMEDEDGRAVDAETFRERIQDLKRTLDDKLGDTAIPETTNFNGRSDLN